MDKQEFLRRLDKYLEGTASDEEIQLLMNYYNSFQQSEDWLEAELGSSRKLEADMLNRLKLKIASHETKAVVHLYNRWWFRIAAAVMIVFSGIIIWSSVRNKSTRMVAKLEVQPKAPSVPVNTTTLSLSNGQIIALDAVPNGIVIQQGNCKIRKQDHKLVYETVNPPASDKQLPAAGHTLSTAKGSQYEIVLPDGSRVWLNTASSLHFPAAFQSHDRSVHITGEAYFEVAKDSRRPFRVYAATSANGSGRALIEVLGTHFNINAYNDEDLMRATLLEGSISISAAKHDRLATYGSRILSAGQQAQIASHPAGNDHITVQPVDVQKVISWKSNVFDFDTADIMTIMRQIARWYNVEVVYEGTIPVRNFSGKINRNNDLSIVLKILEQSNIHFRLEGNRIIVKA